MLRDWLTVLNHNVITCTRCPRLVKYREEVAHVKRRRVPRIGIIRANRCRDLAIRKLRF